MTTTITATGQAHLNQLNAGTATTSTYDAIEFGEGGVASSAIGDRSDLTEKITGTLVQVAAGYPKLNDSDIRNDGRGADVWTWRFVVPEGVGFIANNYAVTNYAAGVPSSTEPVMVADDAKSSKREDQELIVFVNVTTAGAPSSVVHVDDAEPEAGQRASWASRGLLATNAPGAQVSGDGGVQSAVREGEPVWTGARPLDAEGMAVLREDVIDVWLTLFVREGESAWKRVADWPLDPDRVMVSVPVESDTRWPFRQGWTFGHTYAPELQRDASRVRLEYTIKLCDSDLTERVIVHEIDYRPVLSR